MDRGALKDRAYKFLESLEIRLISETPSPAAMRQSIRETVASARNDVTRKHMRQPENVFLYHYAIPIIFRHMQTVPDIGETKAKQSLLSAFDRNIPDRCVGTPARKHRHPFGKVLGARVSDIVAQWAGTHGPSLKQACPDFAFREPFPFKIVFEGKYFQTGGTAAAQNELARNIYQAFFYRALPYVAPKKSSPAWDYEFACRTCLRCIKARQSTTGLGWVRSKSQARLLGGRQHICDDCTRRVARVADWVKNKVLIEMLRSVF
jgi:hypothetical protein